MKRLSRSRWFWTFGIVALFAVGGIWLAFWARTLPAWSPAFFYDVRYDGGLEFEGGVTLLCDGLTYVNATYFPSRAMNAKPQDIALEIGDVVINVHRMTAGELIALSATNGWTIADEIEQSTGIRMVKFAVAGAGNPHATASFRGAELWSISLGRSDASAPIRAGFAVDGKHIWLPICKQQVDEFLGEPIEVKSRRMR